jgi:DNA-binding GntR family transcriptional regulator
VNHRAASTARAYAFIRNKILDATYASGTILSANALARQIGVSRTPVQDALQRLQLDGLVTIRAKIGATVKFMNLPDFKELCWMRLILESNAAGLAATEHTTND